MEQHLEIYDRSEFRQHMDGWSLYKKNKFNLQPVRRYISLVQDDFNKNKIIVSANLSNLFNTYLALKYYA